MKHTELLNLILEKANSVKDEFANREFYFSHFAVAVADFCKESYTGFCVSDTTFFPSRFEEERLRYIFSKSIKLSSYFRMVLSKNSKNGSCDGEVLFDITECEKLAKVRNADVLSADVVFVYVLSKLESPYNKTIKIALENQNSIIEILEDTDKNIYTYVAENIKSICDKLSKKANEAIAIRDWKPAKKFTEPQMLYEMFFENIKSQITDKSITVIIPKFFGANDLKLSIHQKDGIFYVHDSGCAIKNLQSYVKDKEKCERILKKVCSKVWIKDGKIIGSFIQTHVFMNYLQMLIFIAHADLYYTRSENQFYTQEKKFVYIDESKSESIDAEWLFKKLQSAVSFDYDENEGLYYWFDTKYSLFSVKPAFLVQTLDDENIIISDKRKGQTEGEIFEAFYWNNDDISAHGRFISKIAKRFGAEFDGKNVYLKAKSKDFNEAVMKFFNMAVILSEFGHNIKA